MKKQRSRSLLYLAKEIVTKQARLNFAQQHMPSRRQKEENKHARTDQACLGAPWAKTETAGHEQENTCSMDGKCLGTRKPSPRADGFKAVPLHVRYSSASSHVTLFDVLAYRATWNSIFRLLSTSSFLYVTPFWSSFLLELTDVS